MEALIHRTSSTTYVERSRFSDVDAECDQVITREPVVGMVQAVGTPNTGAWLLSTLRKNARYRPIHQRDNRMKRPRCFNCQKFVRRLYIQVQREGSRKMVPWGWVCESCQLRSTQLDTIATHLDVQ